MEIAERHPDVIFMTADLQPYVDLHRMPVERPKQFLDVGMAEQNLLSIGAGLSKAGFIPVATTFACYASRRAFDQMVICMGTGPRTCVVIGFTPGIVNPARIHHQATEDLAMTRAVPNATVIDPADAVEFMQAVSVAVTQPGLVYLRGHRGVAPQIFDPETYRYELGKTYVLKEGKGPGVIATGSATQWALEASDLLARAGVEHGVLHAPTLKPVREDEIWEFCRGRKQVFSLENHQITGGLGSLVAEVLAGREGGPKLTRLGVPNQWAPGGTLSYIRGQLALDAESLAKRFQAAA
ncbi:MAG: transketolase family protein [Pikeienuella sp.]